MRVSGELTVRDYESMQAFMNYLSWGEQPGSTDEPVRAVPPAWWAYALGATTYCPPKGEL